MVYKNHDRTHSQIQSVAFFGKWKKKAYTHSEHIQILLGEHKNASNVPRRILIIVMFKYFQTLQSSASWMRSRSIVPIMCFCKFFFSSFSRHSIVWCSRTCAVHAYIRVRCLYLFVGRVRATQNLQEKSLCARAREYNFDHHGSVRAIAITNFWQYTRRRRLLM